MNDKLQEIFNKAYWDLHEKYKSLNYYDVKPFQDKLPYTFIELLEKYDCFLQHILSVQPSLDNLVIVKHPLDVQYGRVCFGNLLIPREFAVKVATLGHLPI